MVSSDPLTIRTFALAAARQGRDNQVPTRYYNRLEDGEIWLLLIYAKSADDNIAAHVLKELKEELEDGYVRKGSA